MKEMQENKEILKDFIDYLDKKLFLRKTHIKNNINKPLWKEKMSEAYIQRTDNLEEIITNCKSTITSINNYIKGNK